MNLSGSKKGDAVCDDRYESGLIANDSQGKPIEYLPMPMKRPNVPIGLEISPAVLTAS